MERLYKKFKGRLVTYQDGQEGVICGWVNDNLLLALETKPIYSFRRFGKESHFLEEQYKESKYRYCYCSENDEEKSKKVKIK